MNIEEMAVIINKNKTNKFLYKNMDIPTQNLFIEIMEMLDINDFVEVNPNGKFCMQNVPFPISRISTSTFMTNRLYNSSIAFDISDIYTKTFKHGANFPHSRIFVGECGENVVFNENYNFVSQSNIGEYDWAKLQDVINSTSKNVIAIFQTHTSLQEAKVLAMCQKNEDLADSGLFPNGAYITLGDIYINLYVNEIVNKHNKNISVESQILLSNGGLVTFSTNGGLSVLNVQNLNKNTLQNQQTKPYEK